MYVEDADGRMQYAGKLVTGQRVRESHQPITADRTYRRLGVDPEYPHDVTGLALNYHLVFASGWKD